MVRLRTPVSLMCMASLVVAACSGGDDDETPDTTVADTTPATTTPERVDDGELRLGILLPTTNAVSGEPMIDAVEQAVREMNDAGGVLGEQVRRYVADEGTNAASAAEGIQALIDLDVDAIIGPSSSTVALSTLQNAVSNGVVTCSPTASSLALDTFPDDRLFFRTIPSDSLQAEALAETVEQTGAQVASILFVDDAYGRPFAEAVNDALIARGVAVAGSIPFTGRDDDLTEAAAESIATEAAAVVVVAAAEDGTNMLSALGQEDHSSVAVVAVNDAMRAPSPPQTITDLDQEFRDKIVGVAPQADSGDEEAPWDPPGFFAVNAYNCANLIALAALEADSDAPAEIAGQMAAVSATGIQCTSFETCEGHHRNGLSYDYDGPGGELELLAGQGDPSVATFDRFTFDESGRDVLGTPVVVRYSG